MPAVLFRQPRTRHPLLRAFSALAGVLILGAALMFGFFLIVALVAVGALIWGVRQFGKPRAMAQSATASTARATPPGVIEGEFVVVREPASPRH